jgi:hypothetical protein
MKNAWKYFLIAALAAIAIYNFNLFGIFGPNPSHLEGESAPMFSLPAYDGTIISLADHHDSVVLLAFWFPT